ncbi:MAG: thiol peroxidase [Panacagrimonas sp.]
MASITLRGNPFQTSGELPAVGTEVPGFRLVNRELKDVSLHDFAGRKKVLNIFPSVDTPTCAMSVKKFNDYARAHKDVVMVMISADLPFAQGRFCGTEGLSNVVTLSMMRGRNFSKDYGVLIENGPLAGLSARACIVLDTDNKVIHAELVKEIADEPDYEAALKVLG